MRGNKIIILIISSAIFIYVNLSEIFGQNSIPELKSMVVKDETLIVPGIGGAGIILDAPDGEVVLLKGKPLFITNNGNNEFFISVINVKSPISLPFNFLYVFNNPTRIIGILNGKVSFIVLLDYNGVLIDGISVKKGIMAIVFNYGNEGMKRIDENWGSIYIYPSKGIAFIDEKSDDTVDGVIIFKSCSN